MNIRYSFFCLLLIFSKYSLLYASTYDILGYESHLSTIYSAQETNKTPVIGVLGFGDPATMYSDKFDTDHTFTVTLSFPDSILRGFPLNPCTIFRSLCSVNIGQELDATALLHAVIECYKKGHKTIHLFSNSRGGGAIITMLTMLSHPEQHRHIWQKFGISNAATQQEIRAMVANGTIFLTHPLLDYSKALVTATGNAALNIYFLKQLFYWTSRTFLHSFTRFDCTYQKPLSILLKNLSSEKWPYSITIALAECDEITSNAYDQLLACLAWIYPEKLTVISGGNSHRDIRSMIQLFHNKLSFNCPSL